MHFQSDWRGSSSEGALPLPRITILDHVEEGTLELIMEGYNPTVINTAVAPDHVLIQGMTTGARGMVGSFQHRVQLPTPVIPESTQARFVERTLHLIMQKKQKLQSAQRTASNSFIKKIRLSRVEEADSARTSDDHTLPLTE